MAQNRLAFPKYRVFVYGREITKDVVTVATNSHDKDSPNTCRIVLVNENNRYTATTKDILYIKYGSIIESMRNIYSNTINAAESKITTIPPKATRSPFDVPMEGESLRIPNGVDVADLVRYNIDKFKFDILYSKGLIKQDLTREELELGIGRKLTNTEYNSYYGGPIKMYPISDGSCILHPMDPVRVVMMDPLEPGRWYWAFSGFVSDAAESLDENNSSIITLVAEDPTKLFRYTRMFLNPGILDAKKVIDQKSDMTVTSFYTNFMQKYTLPEICYTLVFGPTIVGAKKLTEQNKDSLATGKVASTNVRKIGKFAFGMSGVYSINNSTASTSNTVDTSVINGISSKNTKAPEYETQLWNMISVTGLKDLSEWQALIDHEVQPSDMYTMYATLNDVITNNRTIGANVYSTDVIVNDITTILEQYRNVAVKDKDGETVYEKSTVDIGKVIEYICTNPDKYPIDGGRLMILIPPTFNPLNQDVVSKDIINDYNMQSDSIQFGKILYDSVTWLQFSLYCSPRGDIIVEWPMYNQDPKQFGVTPVSVTKSMYGSNGDFPDVFKYDYPRGPFAPRYNLLRNDHVNLEYAFTDSKVYTMATAPRNIFKNYSNLGDGSIVGDVIVTVRPNLVPMFGVRNHAIHAPTYSTTVDGIKQFMDIELDKTNFDARSTSLSYIFNIGLWINRPIYVKKKNFIGTVKRIDWNIQWGQGADSSMDLCYVRTWDGDIDNNGDMIYVPLGGQTNSPMNYSIIHGIAPKPIKG